ncbi:MAG: GNAT family N-acetyltransferase [Caldilineaceae bacterium]|nr:GNAT family N-acetyltransferase [Caldilineaceae bacterium]
MTVSLRPITVENWPECVELKPGPDQNGFVAPNAVSLAQAHFEPWWEPYGIYVDDRMVGFIMYGYWPQASLPAYYGDFEAPQGVICILRFMVDANHQRQGYGRAALAQTIERCRQRPGVRAVHLSYEPSNSVAAALYASLGFRPTGRILDGEVETWLDL